MYILDCTYGFGLAPLQRGKLFIGCRAPPLGVRQRKQRLSQVLKKFIVNRLIQHSNFLNKPLSVYNANLGKYGACFSVSNNSNWVVIRVLAIPPGKGNSEALIFIKALNHNNRTVILFPSAIYFSSDIDSKRNPPYFPSMIKRSEYLSVQFLLTIIPSIKIFLHKKSLVVRWIIPPYHELAG